MALRIGIAGVSGRRGLALVEATLAAPDLQLTAALDVASSTMIGADAGRALGAQTGVIVGADIDAAVLACDVLIDFTRPEGTIAHAEACVRHRRKLCAGTTGLGASQKAALATLAQQTAIVFAPNMSAGVNVLVAMVEFAAARLGPGFDIEILEMHHRHKIDAPSGTALRLGEAAAKGAGVDLAAHAVYAREGVTGERKAGTIGFATLRGGDVVGEHTVVFAGAGERIELTHRASSRATFAAGALRAARFVAGRSTGLYDMADVLGLG